ncbi:MAG: META domain-containing protein [Candidatus Kapaibacterium sp.]|nr:META domain-containing protein [Ignavibacteriota bacterium]MCB9222200.1 META domain-containing protein [Ignavibacteria bacterium]
MKNTIYLLLAFLLFSACKDPNVGPDDDQNPQNDAGYIQFESPAVGQKSSFIHYYTDGYWTDTPAPIKYTKDTIHWEITKQIDGNTFEITERLAGEYFGDNAINRQIRFITMSKDGDKIIFTTERSTSSPLLGHREKLELALGNSTEYKYKGWRIDDNNTTAPQSGYVTGYKVKDKTYDRLDFYTDFTPTHHDGFGLMFTYNSKYGMVRHYAMNPWLGDVNGFDLIRDMKKPSDSKNNLSGTDWILKEVEFKDGTIKSIEAIISTNGNANINPNFTLSFKNDQEIYGSSGCNSFGGSYKVNGSGISIENMSSTLAYCTFTDIYMSAIRESNSFSLSNEKLVLISAHSDVKRLIFEYKDENSEKHELVDTKWKLRAVHYPKGEVVPIERVLGDFGSNNSFNQFVLHFKENNTLGGFSGCNTYGGTYKVEKNYLKIVGGSITEVACKFSADYDMILNNSTTFTTDTYKLIINSSIDKYVALEFDRIR